MKNEKLSKKYAGAPKVDSPPAEETTVIIVEDERLIANHIAIKLRQMGYKALASHISAEDALEEIERLDNYDKAPDLVLMDIELAGDMDGVEAAEIISQKYPSATLFMTAHTDEEVFERALKAKPYAFIGKPFDPPEFERSVRIALYQRRLEIELIRNQIELEDKVRKQTALLRQTNKSLKEEIQERESAENELKKYAEDLEAARAVQEENSRQLALAIEKMEEAKLQAEKANRAKSEFLANMSHEIRTPMNAILGFTEIMLDKTKSAEEKNYLTTILNSGKSLLSLINDILDLSKVEAGKIELSYEPMSVSALIEEIADVFEPKVREKQLDLFVNIQAGFPDAIIFDEARLRQMLFNLVGNALKFTEKGFVQINVNFEKNPGSDRTIKFIVEVCDTGVGVAPDQRNAIFEAFKQQSGQSARKYGGTGLGLTITKKLASKMNGRIELESASGAGSTFRLVFDSAAVSGETPARAPREHDVDEDVDFGGATVLVADDSLYDRKLSTKFLEGCNLKIYESGKPSSFFSKFEEARPAVVLLDDQFFLREETKIAESLSEAKNSRNIEIILTAASISPEAKLSAKSRKLVDGKIQKPFSRNELIATLAKRLAALKSKSRETVSDAAFDPAGESATAVNKILPALEGDFMRQWKSLNKIFMIKRAKSFAESLRELGRKEKVKSLETYGAKLYEYADGAVLEKAKSALDDYPKLIGKMKEFAESDTDHGK